MINRVILQGRLVRDVELESVGGFDKARFTVAWSEKYKETEHKCFLNCEAWRGTATFISNFFSKGSEIAIEGQMITDTWEKDGQKQSRTFCNVEKAHFCGSKASNTETLPPTSKDNSFIDVPDDIDGELPFK